MIDYLRHVMLGSEMSLHEEPYVLTDNTYPGLAALDKGGTVIAEDWTWMTHDQMRRWHQEDEEWWRNRKAMGEERERQYYSPEASMDRLLETEKKVAEVEARLQQARSDFDGHAGPAGPCD